MSSGAVRWAVGVFLVGVVGVWLVKPIGDACPDVSRLPPGSQSASSPSFAPPLTRSCTYTTADGTQARKRYVPIVDWLVLAVVAGVVGVGVAMLGPGQASGAPGAPRPAPPERAPPERPPPERPPPERPPEESPPPLADAPDHSPPGDGGERAAAEREQAAAERERAREARAKRRRRDA